MTNSEPHSEEDAPIPWDGVAALARFWAGSGSLVEWLPPPEWEIAEEWSADATQARLAQVLLLHLQETILPFLPRYPNQWLDLLEQQLVRSREFDSVPSAHTDWVATLSEFGRYPSEQYIDRRPYGTFDTPLTRTLKWFCAALLRGDTLVDRVLGHLVLTPEARGQVESALDVSEVRGAADSLELDEHDASACVDAGGVWSLIGSASRLLAALWHGGTRSQVSAFAPILPELRFQLFELGVLSLAALAAHNCVSAEWRTRAPLAAARPGWPCIEGENSSGSWLCFYQTVPAAYRSENGPYRRLGGSLGGRPLRPDLWIASSFQGRSVEVLVECKYSRRAAYVAEGIPQVMAYWLEYPPREVVQRIHMVVGPATVVPRPTSLSGRWVVGDPAHLAALVEAVCVGSLNDLLDEWA